MFVSFCYVIKGERGGGGRSTRVESFAVDCRHALDELGVEEGWWWGDWECEGWGEY